MIRRRRCHNRALDEVFLLAQPAAGHRVGSLSWLQSVMISYHANHLEMMSNAIFL